MNLIRITSRFMGSSMATLTSPLTQKLPHDQIFKRFFCTKSFEKFSQKDLNQNLSLKKGDIVVLSKGNPIQGENLSYSEGRPVYIIGELFGRLIGVFLTSQNIDKNSLHLTPNENNNLISNSQPIFNQWVSFDPKTQLVEKWGFNDNPLLHTKIITKAAQQVTNALKNSSIQGSIYEVKTINERFNVFVISNYTPTAPVHIGIKITNTSSIADPNKQYIIPIEWHNQAGHKKSQPLDMRDINSYSQETMLSIGKSDDKSSIQIQKMMVQIFKEWKTFKIF